MTNNRYLVPFVSADRKPVAAAESARHGGGVLHRREWLFVPGKIEDLAERDTLHLADVLARTLA